MNRWKSLLLFIAVLAITSCDFFTSGGGGTEGEGLSGQIVNPQGNPVAGASIRIYSSETLTDSTQTDSRGRFLFPGLKDGRYNLEGSYEQAGSTTAILIPGILFRRNLDLGIDTLLATGGILVKTQMDGTPLEGAQCYVAGSSFLAISDDLGRCLITGVPPGTFRVRLRYNGLLPVTSGDITVQAGMIADAGTLLLVADPGLPPPEPKGISIGYDTTLGVVTLNWNRVRVEDLAGYLVYRRGNVFSTPEVITPSIIADTVFKDTLSRKNGDSLPLTFWYQVKSLDSNANMSQFSQPGMITVVPPNLPSFPTPENQAAGRNQNVNLSWRGISKKIGDSVTYTVFMDTVSPPSTVAAQGLKEPYFASNGLLPGRTYSWRVVAHVSSTIIQGPVWSFTTRLPKPGNNSAPVVPGIPLPENYSQNQGRAPLLSWSGGDRDPADSVRYAVYLWPQETQRTQIASNLSAPQIQVSSLQSGTRYFWQVHASDGQDTTFSPIWSFTTQSSP